MCADFWDRAELNVLFEHEKLRDIGLGKWLGDGVILGREGRRICLQRGDSVDLFDGWNEDGLVFYFGPSYYLRSSVPLNAFYYSCPARVHVPRSLVSSAFSWNSHSCRLRRGFCPLGRTSSPSASPAGSLRP